ncbi:hypothetical protein PR202_ga30174 [Eleusine coracana subsp. coracana]|uniref:FH2 domain-containing protein n=1 Tax=Eleusine coracana subsp. coracana TaxID=191504 RepID=A0AAV5DP05_ELECO|nr:hypothetical protein PR202_ga30174 [Eleusine coracana subsp. coracana]
MKNTAKQEKPKSKSKDSSLATVIAGLSVACLALVALICLCCCACRGNNNAESLYDRRRDDTALLSLNLSDLSGATSIHALFPHSAGSSRKSCVTPIDVNRLGALSHSSSQSQNNESSLPSRVGQREMSMRSEFERRSNVQAMKLSSHEITTIAGHPVSSAHFLSGKAASAVPFSASDGTLCTSSCWSLTTSPPPPPPFPKPSIAAPAPPPAMKPAPAPPMKLAPSQPGPPSPPAPRVPAGPGPPPPPQVRAGAGPPPPAMPGPPKARGPPPFKKPGNVVGSQAADSNKTKLKPFFWDKVNANADQAMVWDQIKAGSFQ